MKHRPLFWTTLLLTKTENCFRFKKSSTLAPPEEVNYGLVHIHAEHPGAQLQLLPHQFQHVPDQFQLNREHSHVTKIHCRFKTTPILYETTMNLSRCSVEINSRCPQVTTIRECTGQCDSLSLPVFNECTNARAPLSFHLSKLINSLALGRSYMGSYILMRTLVWKQEEPVNVCFLFGLPNRLVSVTIWWKQRFSAYLERFSYTQ